MENGLLSSSSEASTVSSIGPSDDVEVRKLKDLVKKLEKQNEHLRHRTGRLNSSANKLPRYKGEVPHGGGDGNYNHAILDSVHDPLDDIKSLEDDDEFIRNSNCNDEFTWLYQSPLTKKKSRAISPTSRFSSPLEWVNQELENPSSPQLASAKRNILYKLNVSYDSCSPDIKHLTQCVEKRLVFPPDEYKPQDATDVQIVARIQQEELRRDVDTHHEKAGMEYPTPAKSPTPHSRAHRGSFDETHERTSTSSSGSQHLVHHLPVPSQTMTTSHGLYPAPGMDEDDTQPSRRSSTPTRNDLRHGPSPSAIGPSPRAKSPARARSPSRKTTGLTRRSLPNSSRPQGSSDRQNVSAVGNSLPSDVTNHRGRNISPSPANGNQPVIKSSLVAPSSKLSRLQPRKGIPSPSASPSLPAAGRGIPVARSGSPLMTQRRSLPRPSQTTTTMKYVTSKPNLQQTNKTRSRSPATRTPPQAPPIEPPNDIWGEDEAY
ncbi:uncharacterized protein LOC143465074 [Clavelina lepadiformis]|uniref:uncharacterized protein LOC143465074 n=1 Tax=Clavelina lepadiformis TaxID=159417 RepID=UPI0040433744